MLKNFCDQIPHLLTFAFHAVFMPQPFVKWPFEFLESQHYAQKLTQRLQYKYIKAVHKIFFLNMSAPKVPFYDNVLHKAISKYLANQFMSWPASPDLKFPPFRDRKTANETTKILTAYQMKLYSAEMFIYNYIYLNNEIYKIANCYN